MNVITITDFYKEHAACAGGREWAMSTGLTTMTELWQREDMRPKWREWIATRPGVLTDRELRLYACWCVRQVWHLLTDDRSRAAVEVAKRHADGLATDAELAEARTAAWAAWAAGAAAWAAARAAAGNMAGAAACAAAWAAAAWAGEAWAAEAVAREAALEAAGEAARAAQARYLLEHTQPNFEGSI